MNARYDRLHADLADLAEQVTVVDLRDRALRTSRKLRTRRTILAAATAFAVLAIGAGTALAVLPGRHTASPVSPGPSGQPSTNATPSRTASPTSAPSTSASPSSPPGDAVPGMYLYRLSTADGNVVNDVMYRAPGSDWQKIANVKAPPTGLLVVSPDHQHIAWYEGSRLHISALDGSQTRTLVANVGRPSCMAPTWAADSRHLLYNLIPASGQGSTIAAVATDGTGLHVLGTTSDTTACQIASPDGSTAYTVTFPSGADPTAATLVAFDGHAAPRTIAGNWPTGQRPHEVVAASAVSTRLLIGTVSTSDQCGCDPPEQYAVVDTATGQTTSLNNSNDSQGSTPISGAFTADGRIVVIAQRTPGKDSFLTVYGPSGSVNGSPTLPSLGYGYLVGLDT
jgi:hypothetical protein